ncbi:hypothetical protein D9M68_657910 [compost metagenome]
MVVLVAYYLVSLKKSPYPVSDFKSFTYRWGFQDSLINSYSSANGNYQYVTNKDSLVKSEVKLRGNDIIFIHNKISELGFWNLPDTIGSSHADSKAAVYQFEFNYRERTKRLLIFSDFDQQPGLLDSAMQIKSLIQHTIDQAEARYHP